MSDIDKILVDDLVENVADSQKPTEEEGSSELKPPSKIKPKTEAEKLLSNTLLEEKMKRKKQEEYIEMIKARALIDYYLQRARDRKE